MSTLSLGVKSNCSQSEVSAEEESVSVGKTARVGAFQDARGKKCITRASTEGIQTTQDLHVRQRTLLKSKGEWVSTPEEEDECLGQLRLTSFYSLRFPSTGRGKYKTSVRGAAKLKSNDLLTNSDAGTKEADVQCPEFDEKDFPVDVLRRSTGKSTKDEDLSKSHNDDTICLCENHDISSHRSSDGVQCGLSLRDQGQPATNRTQEQTAGCECVTEQQFTTSESAEGQSGVYDPPGRNAEGELSHSNLIPFREYTGPKANSDCQVCACSPTAINQALSRPSFHSSHYGYNLKSDFITSSAAMFTSTLVSVLAPHWSGRLRRHKRGFSDVGSDIAQNTNLSAALSQNEQQQRFPLQHVQAPGEPVNDFDNKLRGSSGANGSSAELRKERLLHLSESKKLFLKTSSLKMNRHAEDQTTEFGNPVHVPLDSNELSRSTLSLHLGDYRKMAQSVDEGEAYSSLRSRPTTSTLLLSSRRLNSRKPSSESFQMNKQLSASISSLNVPSKSILRISQQQPNSVFPNDSSKETLMTKNILTSYEQLSDTHKPKPFSPKLEEMDSLRKQHSLITGDFDMYSRTAAATNNATREKLFSTYTTRFNQSETLRSVQDRGTVDLGSITDDKNLQDLNDKIPERSSWKSLKENANSQFVFPEVSSNLNSESILKRQVSKTSMTSTNLDASPSVRFDRINDVINSNRTSSISNTTSPRTIQSFTTSPSISLTTAPPIQADQNSLQNSSGSIKPPSSPVNSIRTRTFTESLRFSPRKDSPVEGTSPSHLWSNYLNSKRQSQESNQSPLDQPSPLSPSEFKARRVCTPSIYKYLRESSPPKSTQASPAQSSFSPQTSSCKQIQEKDKNTRNLWFTFDSSPIESHEPLLKPDPSTISAPQSLPPDTDRRAAPRLSKSPYSTLISTRQAANGLSSPHVTQQHSRSFSYGGSLEGAKSPRVPKRSYTSVLRERLSQRKPSLGDPVGFSDAAKPFSTRQHGFPKGSTDAKFPDCQTDSLITGPTHPKQPNTVIRNIPYEGPNGIFLSQGDKSNNNMTDRLNSKEHSLTEGPSRVSEAVQKGGVTEPLQTNGTFQTTASPNSKRGLFSLRSKKDNVLASSLSADKEDLAVKKCEMTGLKSTNRVDQVLNRLRLTFGGRFLEDSDMTSRRKTKKEEALNNKAYESIKKLKESDDLTSKRQTKPKELLDHMTSERTIKVGQMDDLTVRTQTNPNKGLDSKALERGRKVNQTEDLTVRSKTTNETLLAMTSERTIKVDQMDDLTVRTQTNPNKGLDSKASERGRKLNQTEDLTVRIKTTNEMLLPVTSEAKKKSEQRLSVSESLKSPKDSPNTHINFRIDSCMSSSPTSGFRHEKQDNLTNTDKPKRLLEKSRNRILGRPISPIWPKHDYNNCYATLPPGKRSRLGPSPTLSPFECSSEDEQSDNVFFSNVRTKRYNLSLGESENAAQSDNRVERQISSGVVLSSSFADLKYGLQRSRSVSVSSVVSGRPSGPGRISTGSRQGSVSDLSSLDGFMTRSRHSSMNSPVGSPENGITASSGYLSYKAPTEWFSSEGRNRSPEIPEAVSLPWNMEADPTPPPSPQQTRRVSQISSPSSTSSWTSPDSLSPRGLLPSRNYRSTLSVFEESDSDTTTDDEYYLNSDDDDGKETEL